MENKIDNSTAPCYPSEAVVQERSLRCAGRGATIHRDPPLMGLAVVYPRGRGERKNP